MHMNHASISGRRYGRISWQILVGPIAFARKENLGPAKGPSQLASLESTVAGWSVPLASCCEVSLEGFSLAGVALGLELHAKTSKSVSAALPGY